MNRNIQRKRVAEPTPNSDASKHETNAVWSPQRLRLLRSRATAWFEANNRPLPWRQTNDPYRIWISEIMLQQTQVATVIPYYQRFLERFPDVRALAEAPIDDVLFHWAGLGYYRRARQLHHAAQSIVASHNGNFPTEFDAIRELAGIGRYTAGAIASFAYDKPFPIVEANTQRLYARLIHLTTPTATASSQSLLWQFAESVLTPTGSGRINHSLMELGSQVCQPKEPRCTQCPLQSLCPTNENGTHEQIPAPKPSKTYIDLIEAALIVRDTKNRILVRRCGADERWAGLWDFPRFDATEFDNESMRRESVATQFRERFGFEIEIGKSVHSVRHAVTKYRIQLHCYETVLTAPKKSSSRVAERTPTSRRDRKGKGNSNSNAESDHGEADWVSLAHLKTLALNSSAKKILKWLDNHFKNEHAQ